MTQQFLVTVQRMCTSDEADLVASWSGVIAEEDLHKIDLRLAAQLTEMTLKDAPMENVRPMTEEEIKVWREGQRGS